MGIDARETAGRENEADLGRTQRIILADLDHLPASSSFGDRPEVFTLAVEDAMQEVEHHLNLAHHYEPNLDLFGVAFVEARRASELVAIIPPSSGLEDLQRRVQETKSRMDERLVSLQDSWVMPSHSEQATMRIPVSEIRKAIAEPEQTETAALVRRSRFRLIVGGMATALATAETDRPPGPEAA